MKKCLSLKEVQVRLRFLVSTFNQSVYNYKTTEATAGGPSQSTMGRAQLVEEAELLEEA